MGVAFVGTGTTISFESGFLAEILDVTPPGRKRESIPTSHMGTTDDHTFTPAMLVDNGELKCELAFDAAATPPMNNAPSSVVITFPDTGGTTWTFDGFLTSYEPKDPLEGRATASVTIKVTGAITIA